MSDLTDFLLARIAEDEWWCRYDRMAFYLAAAMDGASAEEMSSACGPGHPRGVLAECEAKRRIVEFHRPSTDHGEGFTPYCVGCWDEGGMDGAPNHPCRTVRLLGLPYADHEDYRQEWRP